MKRRKGETLAEFIMATWIFAMVMTWVVGFITGQTQAFVNIKNRDDIMYKAKWLNHHDFMYSKNITREMIISGQEYTYGTDTESINYVKELQSVASFDWNKSTKTLTVKQGNALSLPFIIAP